MAPRSRQDLPPQGGYGPIMFRRNLPDKGIKPKYAIMLMIVVTTYSSYLMCEGIRERRELWREKTWARIHLTPMLQAEADRDDVRRYFANLAREEELMKDYPGWAEKSKIYNNDRFIRPTYAIGPDRRSLIEEEEYEAIVAAAFEEERKKKEAQIEAQEAKTLQE